MTNPNALNPILGELSPLLLSEQVELVNYLVKIFEEKPLNALTVVQSFKFNEKGVDLLSIIMEKLFTNAACLKSVIWREENPDNSELIE